jgi:amino acid transporter
MTLVSITGGFVFGLLAVPFFFPGANMILVYVLGVIPAIPFIINYSIFGTAMPRAGGDYVWTGRIIGPRFAAIMAVILLFSGPIISPAINIWVLVTFGLSSMFFGLGFQTSNPAMVSLGIALSQMPLSLVIAVLVNFLVFVVALLGIETYKKVNLYLFVLYAVTLVVFIGALVSIDTRTFVNNFDAAMNNYNVTYAGVLSAVNSNVQSASFNLNNTLLASIPSGFLYYMGFNFNTYLSGETRNVKRTISLSLILSVLTSMVVVIILTTLAYNAFGGNFVDGISYLYNSGSLSSFPITPAVNLFISLATSTWLGLLININIIVGLFLVSLSYVVTFSRIMFAMAFDRILPIKVASVNLRFHSPHVAILVSGVGSVIATYCYITGFAATYLNTALALPVAYIIPGFAALLFSFIRRDLYDRTVKPLGGWPNWQVGGVPLLTIGGLAVIIIWIFGIYSVLFPISSYTYLGSSLPIASGITIGLVITGLFFFEVSRAYHKRKDGFDIMMSFKEIPPE